MIEQFPKHEENKSLDKKRNLEDVKIKNAIEVGVMKSSGADPIKWAEQYGKKCEAFFSENKELIENLYSKNPTEAIALTKQVLESKGDEQT